MSWSVSVSGHENEGPNPPDKEKLDAVAAAAVAAAREQGLNVTYASHSKGQVDLGDQDEPATPSK